MSAAGAASLTQRIIAAAAASEIAQYRWKDRGRSPAGYIKGMALVAARLHCKLKMGDAAVSDMARAARNDPDHDALAWYRDVFGDLGMDNSADGPDTLRHLLVLLTGLGMRESSGKHCEGRDTTATNTTAETAEAGLFQTSFNARTAHPLLPDLFTRYDAQPSGFLDVFREGATCSAADAENFGTGPGVRYQELSKICPAFAAEFTALAMRHRRRHWGPLSTHKAEVKVECDTLLRQVQAMVDADAAGCGAVL